jgi:hypothetical protein
MSNPEEASSSVPLPEVTPPAKDSAAVSSRVKQDQEETSAVPRWLKIAAVAVPIVATICAGIWTLSSVLMSQYVTLQTTLENERTQQTRARAAEADSSKQTAELRLAAEKETARRIELQLNGEANARKDEIQLQRLRTEEQQARQSISENEINRQIAADKITAQIQDDGSFAALAAAISSNVEKTDGPPRAVSLAALMRYANNSRYADVLSAALVTQSARVAALEEAQLCMRLAQAIQPIDFELMVKINRLARRKVEEREIYEFWRRYTPHAEKMPPHDFLRFPADGSPVDFDSFTYAGIQRDIDASFIDLQESPDTVRNVVATKKSLKLPDPAVVEANEFLMAHTADVMMQYIDAYQGKPITLDVSGCYMWREPKGGQAVKLIARNTFFENR